MISHDDIIADLPLFALGSLDPDEHRAIADHLASGCPTCRIELAQWGEVVGMLPLASSETAPPRVRTRLLRGIRAPRPPRRARARWQTALALAAGVILVLIAADDLRTRSLRHGQAVQLAAANQQLSDARARYADLTKLLTEREQDVSSLRAALDTARQSMAIMQSPGLQLIQLGRTAAEPMPMATAEGHLLLSAAAQRGVFYVFNLPPAPADKAYELWWITADAGPVPAGVFHAQAGRVGRVDVAPPQGAGAIQAAAVSIEPAGGMPKPTGPIILQGAMARG